VVHEAIGSNKRGFSAGRRRRSPAGSGIM